VVRNVLLLAAALVVLALPSHASSARVDQVCGLPDTKPLWIDYSDGTVPFGLQLFGRPGITIATQGAGLPPQFRGAGAGTTYWEMKLGQTVGTTTSPADPATIDSRAQAMFDRATTRSNCSTPLIALNELNGAGTTTPWSATNAQYRANVLELVRHLASKGARPFLLVNSEPYTGGEAADWWRQVAQVSDIVSEDYFIGPNIYKLGPILGSRRLRFGYRQSILDFTQIGIPVSRLGIMLGFQSGPGTGGREGLQPTSAWLEVVKLQTLAARQVAADLGIATVWSWGWGTFSQAGSDPDKQAAACVYLWARDQTLCDGVGAAGTGFDDSLTEGQITLPVGIHCTVDGSTIRTVDIAHLGAVTGDPEVAFTALYERIVESGRAAISHDRILAAEQNVIALRFNGSRAAYVAALAAKHATVGTARNILGDELRRAQIAETLTVPAPTEAQIEAFYADYPATLVRLVRASPAPAWLGGKTQGLAISPVVPDRLFTLARGQVTTLLAADGSYSVQPLDETLPLSAVPLSIARPAITTALTAFAQADAVESWTEARQATVLNQAVCRGDHLPQIGEVDLSTYLPFLALDG
jgi:hypothetical protein